MQQDDYDNNGGVSGITGKVLDYLEFGPGCKWYFVNGTPHSSLSGIKGDLCTDMDDGIVYHCSGTTTWDPMSD
jgi:hypothetical protein